MEGDSVCSMLCDAFGELYLAAEDEVIGAIGSDEPPSRLAELASALEVTNSVPARDLAVAIRDFMKAGKVWTLADAAHYVYFDGGKVVDVW